MKATDLLESQHKEVKTMLERIERMDSGRERTAMVREVASSLVGHMAIEQEIFYPAAARAIGERTLVIEALEEHGIATFALERLLEATGRAANFDARVKVLKDLVLHHVEEEESELLPKVERAIDERRLERLGMQLSERFQELQEQGFESVLNGLRREARPRGRGRTMQTPAARAAAKKRSGRRRTRR